MLTEKTNIETRRQAFRRIALAGHFAPVSCNCDKCRDMCRTPCLGTPQDMMALIEAGYADRLSPTLWAVGMVNGLTDRPVKMVQPRREENGWCTFFHDGKCELHDKGLKPTEGVLANCRDAPRFLEDSLTWAVAREWIPIEGMI